MGCQEMKEKKKQPINKPKEPEKENNEINPDDKKESKPLDDQNIINIEKQESPIKEDKQILGSDKLQDIKEDEKIESILKLAIDPYYPNYIGKLCFDPLDLFIYDTKKHLFHVQKYKDEENSNFEKLTNTSSCCNGDDKLFISGGIDSDKNIIDKLWIFDLVNYNVECLSDLAPKNNHSMIYIPSEYIF